MTVAESLLLTVKQKYGKEILDDYSKVISPTCVKIYVRSDNYAKFVIEFKDNPRVYLYSISDDNLVYPYHAPFPSDGGTRRGCCW